MKGNFESRRESSKSSLKFESADKSSVLASAATITSGRAFLLLIIEVYTQNIFKFGNYFTEVLKVR